MRVRHAVTALVSVMGLALAVAAPATAAPSTTQIVLRQEAPVIVPLTEVAAGATGYSFAYEGVLRNAAGKRVGLLSGVVQTIDATLAGVAEETRHREIVFSLKGGQIVAQGVTNYVDSQSEVAKNRPVVIAVIGGTREYMGARGQVVTTRQADGSYRQVITLLK